MLGSMIRVLLQINSRVQQGQTNHKAPEARASGPAAWRGLELEGC